MTNFSERKNKILRSFTQSFSFCLQTGEYNEAKREILALVIANMPVLQFHLKENMQPLHYIDQIFNAVEGNSRFQWKSYATFSG